jgi:hypothetical protein
VATLDDLLVPRSRDTIEALLLSTLQAEGFPVTDWQAGGVARTLLKMIATGLLDRETLIQYLAAGGYLDLAAVLVDANGTPVESWLVVLAEQMYGITRAAATYTKKSITLTCTSGPGPYTRAAGQLVAVSQAGNYYTNVAEVTIPDGGSTIAVFQAQTPGSGVSDATGTIDELVTPLPGVSIVDAQTQFSVPSEFRVGSGTITPSATGTPSPARTIKFQCTTSGQLSGSTAYYKITTYTNGVAAEFGPYQMTSSTYAQGDVTLTFADGSSGTSFVAGDILYVSTPGEPTIQNGTDEETLASLAQRCRDRWPSLSAIPTESKYAAWVRQCSIDSSLGINRVSTAPSNTVAGYVNVYVADQTGTATPETVTALQAYIDKRTVDIERAVVNEASGKTITVTGTAQVKRGQLATVKAAAKAAWATYLAEIPIGGDLPGGIVKYAKLWETLMDAGCYDAVSLQMNAGIVDVVLAADEVPTVAASGTDNLTWVEVA